MSFATTGESRRKNNEALLKKKRYFDFHQNVIQKHFLKGSKKKNKTKELTAKQKQNIRLNLILEKREDYQRKILVFGISFVLMVIFISVIVYIFTEYVF